MKLVSKIKVFFSLSFGGICESSNKSPPEHLSPINEEELDQGTDAVYDGQPFFTFICKSQ